MDKRYKKSFEVVSNVILPLVAGMVFALSTIACSGVKFSSKGGDVPDEYFGNNQPGSPGIPVDPGSIPLCENIVVQGFQGVCLIFQDRFERSAIVDHNDFRWETIIMDNGYNGSNVDAKIETSNHLGPIVDGDRAILFRGREGGSTHEIYLISHPFDFSGFDMAYIQFEYLPIHLESQIQLTYNGRKIPESVRVDLCQDTDLKCGLSGSNRHEQLRDITPWEAFFPSELAFGRNLNIRNYQLTDWKLGQALIDLKQFTKRQDKFVFRVAAAMDEGYHGNNRNNQMEDGIIFDNIILVAVKRNPNAGGQP